MRGTINPAGNSVATSSTRYQPSRSCREAADRVPHAKGRTRLMCLPVPPTTTKPPSYLSYAHTAERGIMRLMAPLKLARIPAPRRQPPPCSALPKPQWAIVVPPTTSIEFTAPTPPLLEDSQPFTSQPEPSQFQRR